MPRTLALLLACVALACGESAKPPSGQVPEDRPSKTGPEGHAHAGRADEAALHAQAHEEEALAAAERWGPGRRAGHHHRFEDAEEWAAKFDSPDRETWQKPDAVVAALDLAPDARVADLGAGTGYFAVRLARAVPRGQVYANDLEPDMVRYLGERASREGLTNLRPVQGAADDPKLPGPVDIALMVDTYHHIDDPTRFFAGVRDALAPGGRLVIVDFRKDAPDDAPGPPAAMRVDDAVVVAHLQKLGFVHERTDRALLPFQYLVFLRKPS